MGQSPIFSRTYNVVHALIQALPPLESKFVGHLGESQVPNGDRVILLLHGRYREVLQNARQDCETHVLDEFVAHAGSTSTAERQKVFRLQQSSVLHESVRHEFLRAGPQIGGHVQIVIVQEDERVLLDSEA